MMTLVDGHPRAQMGGKRAGNWSRCVGRDAKAAKRLARRTLTNLYNERRAWLDLAHKKLDTAVFAACGRPIALTDEEILEKLSGLNLERALAERCEEA